MSSRHRPRGGRRSDPDRGSIHPTLDLHGETADSARRKAEMWLRRMAAEGEGLVRIVTGRGKHSVAGPVLRGEIEDLLSTLGGELVRRAEEEAGGGAFRVLLRPRTGPVPPRPPPIPRAPPELRRRAEEALAELGIQPTPEMLAAEIRRLRDIDEDPDR